MNAVFIESTSKKRIKDTYWKRAKDVDLGSKNSVIPCN